MKKLFSFLSLFLFFYANANISKQIKISDTLKIEEKKPIPSTEPLRLFNLDGLFRGAAVSDNNKNNNKDNANYLLLEEARLNFQGAINEDVSYRVRFRLNRC